MIDSDTWDRMHSWLDTVGQCFRVESVGRAHPAKIPSKDLSGAMQVTIYEVLPNETVAIYKRFDYAIRSVYKRMEQIRDLAHREAIILESEAVPVLSFSEHQNTLFATWIIYKTKWDNNNASTTTTKD